MLTVSIGVSGAVLTTLGVTMVRLWLVSIAVGVWTTSSRGTELDTKFLPQDNLPLLQTTGVWLDECNRDLERTLVQVPISNASAQVCSTLKDSNNFMELNGTCQRKALYCSKVGDSLHWNNFRPQDRYVTTMELEIMNIKLSMTESGNFQVSIQGLEGQDVSIYYDQDNQCTHTGVNTISKVLQSRPIHEFHIGVMRSDQSWYHYRRDDAYIIYERFQTTAHEHRVTVEQTSVEVSFQRKPWSYDHGITTNPQILDQFVALESHLQMDETWGCSLLNYIDCHTMKVAWSKAWFMDQPFFRHSTIFLQADFRNSLNISLSLQSGIEEQVVVTRRDSGVAILGMNQAHSIICQINPDSFEYGLVAITEKAVLLYFPQSFTGQVVIERTIDALLMDQLRGIHIQTPGSVEPLVIISKWLAISQASNVSPKSGQTKNTIIILTCAVSGIVVILLALAWTLFKNSREQPVHQHETANLDIGSGIPVVETIFPPKQQAQLEPSGPSGDLYYYDNDEEYYSVNMTRQPDLPDNPKDPHAHYQEEYYK